MALLPDLSGTVIEFERGAVRRRRHVRPAEACGELQRHGEPRDFTWAASDELHQRRRRQSVRTARLALTATASATTARPGGASASPAANMKIRSGMSPSNTRLTGATSRCRRPTASPRTPTKVARASGLPAVHAQRARASWWRRRAIPGLSEGCHEQPGWRFRSCMFPRACGPMVCMRTRITRARKVFERQRTARVLANSNANNTNAWFIKAGIKRTWTPLGATVIWGEGGQYLDMYAGLCARRDSCREAPAKRPFRQLRSATAPPLTRMRISQARR